ncbi:MAG: glycosyltransferase family 4 protein [Anaerolineales bacterium]|jgi:polysaccharide biosynthesis protein PslH
MRILLLTQVLPFPPDSGPKVKTWNVIKYLARHHEVTLVSFVRGDQSASVRHLQNYCREVHPVPIQRGMLRDLRYLLDSFLTRQPFLMVRDRREEMERLVDQLAAKVDFDVVHADQLNMAQYASRVPAARRIIDAHNALWLLYKRLWLTMQSGPKKWLLNRDWQLIKKYEGQVCREFDAVLAVSEEDSQALEEAAGQKLDITIIPIAIDTDEITPITHQPQGDRILHIGTMYWPPNIDGILWFLSEVLPLIRNERPEVEFDIVGANPPKEIIAFDEVDRRVHVTGYVDDPTSYLEQASLMVVPLRAGGGMRVKILNALGQGLPIVSTTLGCEGIAVQAGVHLLVADSPQDFAGAVIRLLEDRQLAGELGRRGRQLIESTYDYRVACHSLEQAYSKANVSNMSK